MPLARPLAPLIAAALLVLALPGVSLAAEQPVSPSPRIINGSQVPEGKWPAQGFLKIGSSRCGGTLVSGLWFLTARHCATTTTPSSYEVTLGKVNQSTAIDADKFGVDRVVLHEDYNPGTYANDLALLHLVRPTAPPIQPLRLVAPSETALWAPGTPAITIGWGWTETSNSVQDVLRETTVPITSDANCNYTDFNPNTMVCAGDGTTDSCKGDSGGPLMVPRGAEYVLVGVTSFGAAQCANGSAPGGYARVGAPGLNQWIRSRIPTVSIAAAPVLPRAGDTVQLSANGVKPDQPNLPTTTWDLDANGTYETPGAVVSLGAPPAGSYPVAVQQSYPDGDRAQSRETVIVGPPAPPAPPVVSQGAPGASQTSTGTPATSFGAIPPFAAKLELARAEVLRSARRLSVLAPITARAAGRVEANFRAAGRTERFTAGIDAAKRRIRIDRSIPASQARLGTGILTLTYPGDDDTQPQEVRLRAASQKANLRATRPKLSGRRLTATGTISTRARGVVRLQLLYEPADASTRTLEFTAPISDGRYSFDETLPAEIAAEIGQRRGVVHSYTLFTGYFPRRVRGEMRSYEVLPAR